MYAFVDQRHKIEFVSVSILEYLFTLSITWTSQFETLFWLTQNICAEAEGQSFVGAIIKKGNDLELVFHLNRHFLDVCTFL